MKKITRTLAPVLALGLALQALPASAAIADIHDNPITGVQKDAVSNNKVVGVEKDAVKVNGIENATVAEGAIKGIEKDGIKANGIENANIHEGAFKGIEKDGVNALVGAPGMVNVNDGALRVVVADVLGSSKLSEKPGVTAGFSIAAVGALLGGIAALVSAMGLTPAIQAALGL